MANSELIHNLGRLPLLTKVCFFTFWFTFLLALSAVTFQTYIKINDERSAIEECFNVNIEPQLEKISELVWKEQFIQLSHFFKSFKLPCDALSKTHNAGLSALFTINDKNEHKFELGSPSVSTRLITTSYPLSFWVKSSGASAYWLGELVVSTSFQEIYTALVDEAFSQILQHFFVSLAGTILGFLLGYKMIIKRIRNFTKQLRSETSYEDMKTYIDEDRTELSSLWSSIISFKESIDSKRLGTDIKLTQCQEELKKAQRDSELKSQFLAKMSHELRTPMNGLLSFSTLLLESKLEDEQKEYAQTIQASLESLLYVVNDVLDLSRIESGDLNITSIPFSLRSVISGVTALLKNRADAKGLEFETRISANVPDNLKGDPVRIRQVIMNLAANAIRHTDKGYVLINIMLVDTHHKEEKQATIRISLEDSGLAIQKRISSNIADIEAGFSSEFRGKRSLGLDICFQLVELMDSQLCNQSKESGGSSYWFDIQLPTITQKINEQLIDYNLLKNIRVLVIDSYELSRKITLELLQEWGIKFEAAGTASEALKLINNYAEDNPSGFNMILCDDLLQDLSGIEACQRFRQVLSPYVSIVVLCSNPQLGDAEGFFLSGANGFLSKQFRDPFLKPVMCQSFSERYAQRQDRRLITRYTISDAEPVIKPLSNITSVKAVLIVESNIINQQLIMNVLEKNHCRVDLASNGFEAIELFKSNNYALIFMDCAMPDMDGFETTLILRELEKSSSDNHRTPIIAMTTHEIDGETDRYYQVGMDELMAKPLKIAKLEMVLGRFIH